MILKKKHFCRLISDVLVDVYKDNNKSFPIKFEDFAKEISTKIYNKFKFLEGNPVIFERVMEMDTLPMNNIYELVDQEREEVNHG
jgi:hypothetical protein